MQATTEWGLGVLVITHYNRLLSVLQPTVVSILSGGRIVATGGPELADAVEADGYVAFGGPEPPAKYRHRMMHGMRRRTFCA